MERELPEGWEFIKIKELFDLKYGKGLKESDRNEEGTIPVFGSNGIVGYHTKSLTTSPTIIIGRKGSIGAVNLSNDPCWPIDTTYYIENPLKLDIKYLFFLLPTLNLQNLNKSTSIPGLNRNDIYAKNIPLPPLETQRQIVAILEKAEKIRRLRAESNALTQRLLQSVFLEMFGDPVTNPMGWKIKSLGEIISKKASNGFFTKNEQYGVGDTQIIWLSDFINKTYASVHNLKKVNVTEKEREKYQVKYGDLLFCRSSLNFEGIGKAACIPRYTSENTIFECHIIKLSLNLNVALPEFIQVQTTFPFFRDQIVTGANTATMTTISQSGITKCKVLLPPISIQNHFMEIVEQLIKNNQVIQKSSDSINMLNDTLMAKAFTGELVA